jgi:O-methyltransferase
MVELYFPFDLFALEPFTKHDGVIGGLLQDLAPLSMSPPLPWGQSLYARLIRTHCNHLRGDFVECGVAQGGMSLFLGHLARETGRKLYALDSFSGLPKPNAAADNPYFRKGDYSARAASDGLFARFKGHIALAKLENTIAPLRGFFSRSLRQLPADVSFSFVHIDADLHGSVLECLRMLYPRLIEGGVLVVDDFFHHAQGSARAVAEYFNSLGYSPLLHVSFPYSVVMIKGEKPPAGLRRALDGNRYSLQLLREDKLLRRVVESSVVRAQQASEAMAADNARRLLQLLQSSAPDTSSDIYEYWLAMADYWDDMDSDSPQKRKAIRI